MTVIVDVNTLVVCLEFLDTPSLRITNVVHLEHLLPCGAIRDVQEIFSSETKTRPEMHSSEMRPR